MYLCGGALVHEWLAQGSPRLLHLTRLRRGVGLRMRRLQTLAVRVTAWRKQTGKSWGFEDRVIKGREGRGGLQTLAVIGGGNCALRQCTLVYVYMYCSLLHPFKIGRAHV